MGFIGSHVAAAFLAQGHEVRVLDCLLPQAWPPSVVPRAADGVEWLRGDVRDSEDVRRGLVGIDAVCHQAALVGLGADVADLPAYAAHNDYGTAVLLAGMADAGVHQLVLASSMVVYGEGAYDCREHGRVRPGPRSAHDLDNGYFDPRCPVCTSPLTPALLEEDAALDPRNAYAAAKVAQEHYAAAWARVTGGSVVALRYHNVYGPWMPRNTPYAGVASLFRSALERAERPRVFEDGQQRRDFVHVRDVAAANLAALGRPPAAGSLRSYNVGTDVPRTVGEMAAELCSAFGAQPPLVSGEYRLGDVRHITASSRRAADELGFRAAVPFAQGVAEFATAPLRGAAT